MSVAALPPVGGRTTSRDTETAGVAAAVMAAVDRLRAGPRPRVHALLAPVAQPFTANLATAVGIDVSMTSDADEVAPMAAASDALLVNLGMLDGPRREGTLAAIATGRPFVLDPVKVDRSPTRLAFARKLLTFKPCIVKGNTAEMAALGPLPSETLPVVTGAVDTIGRSAALRLANGDRLMDRMIATGCAEGAVMAGYLAITNTAAEAAAAAISHLNVAAERAARRADGPGSFAVALLDVSASLSGTEVAAALRFARKQLDLSCYLVLGPDVADPVAITRAAVSGGATCVQWRDKTGSTADQIAAVRRLMAAVDVPVFVNDRADVAALAGAHLHVGHGDLSPAEARRLMPTGDIGLTVHSLDEADAAPVGEIAYASVGGVFDTSSKDNPNPPIGLDGFSAIAQRLRSRRPDLPICAIAGIDAARASTLAAAGADGVAVMSAITKAEDPCAAATAIVSAVRAGWA